MCSWNINGIKDKIELQNVFCLLHKFDIIWISEIKTNLQIHLPGFYSYRNVSTRYSNHGGIILFIKNELNIYVKEVKFERDDGIWLSLTIYPDILFGGFYVPPTDSKFHDDFPFASIMEKIQLDARKLIIMGDFNSKIIDYNTLLSVNEKLVYVNQPEAKQNANGKVLQNICKIGKLVILNNLLTESIYFQGALTFRKRNKWISELDLCVLSRDLIECVTTFNINHDLSLPSNHAPISLVFNHDPNLRVKAELLSQRASQLDLYVVPDKKKPRKNPIPYETIDVSLFTQNIIDVPVPDLPVSINNIDQCVGIISNTLYELAGKCRRPDVKQWNQEEERWIRLINTRDSKLIWKSINWNGHMQINSADEEPKLEDFKCHFNSLLNPQQPPLPEINEFESCPYIPVLDSPFNMDELVAALVLVKPNKATDLSGNSPGVYRHLPIGWLMFMLNIFNVIFNYFKAPGIWSLSKLFVLFKKGKNICSNYRGISINDNMFKIFDRILYKRLSLWYKPEIEQAGAQKGRDCLEQILTIRLLCDYAKKSKHKLFLLFIDFEKAYDKVPRNKLLQELKLLGCGHVFIRCLCTLYSDIKFMFKSTTINTSLGVKQGAATSCLLFIIYVDRMIKMINACSTSDDFLGNLHTLLLMDDTVLLATNRKRLKTKFEIVQNFCNEYGMTINIKKTKFMVINGDLYDKNDIFSEGIHVQHTYDYIYLGSPITEDGNYASCLRIHVKEKIKHVLKFVSFINKHSNMPYKLKKQVAESCIFSTILYACETWFCDTFSELESMYMKIIKILLAVRRTSCNEICLIEAGMLPLKNLIESKRDKYIKHKFDNIVNQSPLQKAYQLANSVQTKSSKMINAIINRNITSPETYMGKLADSIKRNNTSSKRITYVEMNPSLSHHNIYKNENIAEYLRISFTRFRVSSHDLNIEKGRWTKIPKEDRKCICELNEIQTEMHVLLQCPLTFHIRVKYNIRQNTIKEFFEQNNDITIAKSIYEVLRLFDRN